jgi:hypothetical protein
VLNHQSRVTIVHTASGYSFGIMRTRTGGGKEGDNQQVRSGGMAPPEAYAGTYEFAELECERFLKHGTDAGLVAKAWELHGEKFTITDQSLDSKGREGFHTPETYTGLLNTSTPPDYDADGNDPKTLTMAFTIDSAQ